MSDTKQAAQEIADKLEEAIALAKDVGLQTLEYILRSARDLAEENAKTPGTR